MATSTESALQPVAINDRPEGRLHVQWFSQYGLLLHLTVVIVCTGCSIATWWQLDRALGGNGLSWAYTFEWPCFGIYAIVLWWKLLHERAVEVVAAADPPPPASYDDTGALTESGHRLVLRAAQQEAARAAEQGGWHP